MHFLHTKQPNILSGIFIAVSSRLIEGVQFHRAGIDGVPAPHVEVHFLKHRHADDISTLCEYMERALSAEEGHFSFIRQGCPRVRFFPQHGYMNRLTIQNAFAALVRGQAIGYEQAREISCNFEIYTPGQDLILKRAALVALGVDPSA